MIDYTAILLHRYKNSEWTLAGDYYEGLTWLSDTAKPSKATLDGLWESVQQEIADEATVQATARQAVLDRLGITADEATLLLG